MSTYHHGDLRNALLDAVGEIIATEGLGAVSLRGAARRAGVSHSAPAHHFGDKTGLLTAFATEGFERFGTALAAAYAAAAPFGPAAQFAAIGRAYIEFAIEHRSYFEVMFRSELIDQGDPELHRASRDAFAVLTATVAGADPATFGGGDPLHAAIAAWGNVHGMATLWFNGAIQQFTDEHVLSIYDAVVERERARVSPPADGAATG
jgi:AcrR family transcriptional regulator